MLADVIRGVVSFANQYTGSVQEPVYWFPWVGDDDNGRPKYAESPIQLSARVDRELNEFNQAAGGVVEYTHRLIFMQQITSVGGDGRKPDPPIDPRDKLVVADGSTSPIVRVQPGDKDPVTGLPFDLEVWLGVRR